MPTAELGILSNLNDSFACHPRFLVSQGPRRVRIEEENGAMMDGAANTCSY